MAVEDDARNLSLARADLGHQHRQPVVLVIVDFDIAGFEPTLDESCGRYQDFRARRVVADQPLSQDPFINHGCHRGYERS